MAGDNFEFRRTTAVLFAAAALVAGILAGSLATAKGIAGHAVPILVSAASNGPGAQVNFQNGFAPVVREVAGSVVNISSSRIVKTGPASPLFNDPLFRQFFGDQFQSAPEKERETSLGSGVIVNSQGYVLTNYHVVEGATSVKVALSDRREFTGKIIGSDKRTDVAVVKIAANNLPAIKLGDSAKLEVGDFCVAVGNPFGLGGTVTSGIISAKGRSGLGIEAYEDFIQTDAPINPGNSGGALVDTQGNLIGINTAILSGSGGNQGIGFAIPVNMARQVMDQIIAHGKVSRAWLGILPQEVTPAIAAAFGLKQPEGILVGEVEPNSPAAHGGIQQGDILLQMNGNPMPEVSEFRIQIGMMAPGTDVHFQVFRNGKQQEITAKLGEMPVQQAQASAGGQQPSSVLDGVSVQTLTPDLAQQVGVPAATKGVVITEIAPASAAEAAGLQAGDVILQVNRKPVENVEQFNAALAPNGKKTVLLLIDRQGSTLYVTVEPE